MTVSRAAVGRKVPALAGHGLAVLFLVAMTRGLVEWRLMLRPLPGRRVTMMAADADPSFEVATIKANNSGVQIMQDLRLDGRRLQTRNSSLGDPDCVCSQGAGEADCGRAGLAESGPLRH